MKHVWLDEGLRPRRGEVGGGDECPKDSLRRSADDTRGRSEARLMTVENAGAACTDLMVAG